MEIEAWKQAVLARLNTLGELVGLCKERLDIQDTRIRMLENKNKEEEKLPEAYIDMLEGK